MSMKKHLLVAMCALALTACSTTPEKITDFVDDTEKNCENFKEKDWEKNQMEYEELFEKAQKEYDQYTDEEKAELGRAIGRYTKLMMKEGFRTLQKTGESLAPMINGFFDSLTEDED